MKEALETNINITVQGGHLDFETKTLLISNNYFSTPDILATFDDNEPLLIESFNYIENNMVDSIFNTDQFIQNSAVSANVKPVFQTIFNQIKQIDISNLTPFLYEVQDAVLNSSLSDFEMKEVLIFIAVSNSSGAFWNANL